MDPSEHNTQDHSKQSLSQAQVKATPFSVAIIKKRIPKAVELPRSYHQNASPRTYLF